MEKFLNSNGLNFFDNHDHADKVLDGNESYGINDWKKRNLKFIRVVSVILSVIFLHQQIGWADGGRAVWAQTKPLKQIGQPVEPIRNNFEMPYDLASTVDMNVNNDSETIIQIQDAHASLAAQYSIANLLDNLVDNYNLSFVALEGAQSGYIDTSILRSCPDAEIRKETADLLMEQGYMSAGEFFAVTTNAKNISLYGVEDNDLYVQNVNSFKNIAEKRAKQVQNINKLLEQLSRISEKACSEELNKFNKYSELHRDGKMSFSDYWESLVLICQKYSIPTKSFTELQKVLDSISLEKSIDFKKANAERKLLIDDLSRDMDKDEIESLVLKSVAFKQNKISQSSYHNDLCDLARVHGIAPEKYKNLIGFTKYITLYETVELFYLYNELEELEATIRHKLYRNDDEKELYSAGKILKLIKQLFSMELTNSEYRYVENNYQNYSAASCSSLVKKMCSKYNVIITGEYDASYIFNEVANGLTFYREAEARNNALLLNTVKDMKREGKNLAALITGGYHTEGLKGLMQKKGLSFLVVIPKFELQKERPYIAILTNKKSQYQKILDSGKYQLAVKPIFDECGGDLNKLKERFILFNLGQAVLQGKDLDAYKKDWVKIYKDYYDEMSYEQANRLSFRRPTPKAFNDCLEDIKIEEINGDAIISDITKENKVRFIAMAKEGKTYSFKTASSSQRKIFTNRQKRPVTIEEKDAKEFLTAFEDMKKQTGKMEELTAKLEDLTYKLDLSVKEKENNLRLKILLVEDENFLLKVVDYLGEKTLNEDTVREVLRDNGLKISLNWKTPSTKIQEEEKDEILRFITKVSETQKEMIFQKWFVKREKEIAVPMIKLLDDLIDAGNRSKLEKVTKKELKKRIVEVLAKNELWVSNSLFLENFDAKGRIYQGDILKTIKSLGGGHNEYLLILVAKLFSQNNYFESKSDMTIISESDKNIIFYILDEILNVVKPSFSVSRRLSISLSTDPERDIVQEFPENLEFLKESFIDYNKKLENLSVSKYNFIDDFIVSINRLMMAGKMFLNFETSGERIVEQRKNNPEYMAKFDLEEGKRQEKKRQDSLATEKKLEQQRMEADALIKKEKEEARLKAEDLAERKEFLRKTVLELSVFFGITMFIAGISHFGALPFLSSFLALSGTFLILLRNIGLKTNYFEDSKGMRKSFSAIAQNKHTFTMAFLIMFTGAILFMNIKPEGYSVHYPKGITTEYNYANVPYKYKDKGPHLVHESYKYYMQRIEDLVVKESLENDIPVNQADPVSYDASMVIDPIRGRKLVFTGRTAPERTSRTYWTDFQFYARPQIRLRITAGMLNVSYPIHDKRIKQEELPSYVAQQFLPDRTWPDLYYNGDQIERAEMRLIGDPRYQLQWGLSFVHAYYPEIYKQFEEKGIKLSVVENLGRMGKTKGDSMFGLISRDPSGPEIMVATGLNSLETGLVLLAEYQNYLSYPRNLGDLISYGFQRITGIFTAITGGIPSYAQPAIEAYVNGLKPIHIDLQPRSLFMHYSDKFFNSARIGLGIIGLVLFPLYILLMRFQKAVLLSGKTGKGVKSIAVFLATLLLSKEAFSANVSILTQNSSIPVLPWIVMGLIAGAIMVSGNFGADTKDIAGQKETLENTIGKFLGVDKKWFSELKDMTLGDMDYFEALQKLSLFIEKGMPVEVLVTANNPEDYSILLQKGQVDILILDSIKSNIDLLRKKGLSLRPVLILMDNTVLSERLAVIEELGVEDKIEKNRLILLQEEAFIKTVEFFEISEKIKNSEELVAESENAIFEAQDLLTKKEDEYKKIKDMLKSSKSQQEENMANEEMNLARAVLQMKRLEKQNLENDLKLYKKEKDILDINLDNKKSEIERKIQNISRLLSEDLSFAERILILQEKGANLTDDEAELLNSLIALDEINKQIEVIMRDNVKKEILYSEKNENLTKAISESEDLQEKINELSIKIADIGMNEKEKSLALLKDEVTAITKESEDLSKETKELEDAGATLIQNGEEISDELKNLEQSEKEIRSEQRIEQAIINISDNEKTLEFIEQGSALLQEALNYIDHHVLIEEKQKEAAEAGRVYSLLNGKMIREEKDFDNLERQYSEVDALLDSISAEIFNEGKIKQKLEEELTISESLLKDMQIEIEAQRVITQNLKNKMKMAVARSKEIEEKAVKISDLEKELIAMLGIDQMWLDKLADVSGDRYAEYLKEIILLERRGLNIETLKGFNTENTSWSLYFSQSTRNKEKIMTDLRGKSDVLSRYNSLKLSALKNFSLEELLVREEYIKANSIEGRETNKIIIETPIQFNRRLSLSGDKYETISSTIAEDIEKKSTGIESVEAINLEEYEQLKVVHSIITDIQQELELQGAKLSSLEQDIGKRKKEVIKDQEKIARLIDGSLETLENKEELENELEDLEIQIAEKREAVRLNGFELKQTEVSIAKMNEDLEIVKRAKQVIKDAYLNYLQEVRQNFEASKEENISLFDKTSVVSKEDLLKEINADEFTLEDALSEKGRIETIIKVMGENAEAQRIDIKALKKELESQEQSLGQKKEDLLTQKKNIQVLIQEKALQVDASNQKMQGIFEQKKKKEAMLQDLEQEIVIVKKAEKDLILEKSKLEDNLGDESRGLRKDIDKLNAEISQIQTDIAVLQEQMKPMENELEKQRSKTTAILDRYKTTISKDLEALNQEKATLLEKADSDISLLQTEIVNANKEKETFLGKLSDKKSEIKIIENRIAEIQKRKEPEELVVSASVKLVAKKAAKEIFAEYLKGNVELSVEIINGLMDLRPDAVDNVINVQSAVISLAEKLSEKRQKSTILKSADEYIVYRIIGENLQNLLFENKKMLAEVAPEKTKEEVVIEEQIPEIVEEAAEEAKLAEDIVISEELTIAANKAANKIFNAYLAGNLKLSSEIITDLINIDQTDVDNAVQLKSEVMSLSIMLSEEIVKSEILAAADTNTVYRLIGENLQDLLSENEIQLLKIEKISDAITINVIEQFKNKQITQEQWIFYLDGLEGKATNVTEAVLIEGIIQPEIITGLGDESEISSEQVLESVINNIKDKGVSIFIVKEEAIIEEQIPEVVKESIEPKVGDHEQWGIVVESIIFMMNINESIQWEDWTDYYSKANARNILVIEGTIIGEIISVNTSRELKLMDKDKKSEFRSYILNGINVKYKGGQGPGEGNVDLSIGGGKEITEGAKTTAKQFVNLLVTKAYEVLIFVPNTVFIAANFIVDIIFGANYTEKSIKSEFSSEWHDVFSPEWFSKLRNVAEKMAEENGLDEQTLYREYVQRLFELNSYGVNPKVLAQINLGKGFYQGRLLFMDKRILEGNVSILNKYGVPREDIPLDIEFLIQPENFLEDRETFLRSNGFPVTIETLFMPAKKLKKIFINNMINVLNIENASGISKNAYDKYSEVSDKNIMKELSFELNDLKANIPKLEKELKALRKSYDLVIAGVAFNELDKEQAVLFEEKIKEWDSENWNLKLLQKKIKRAEVLKANGIKITEYTLKIKPEEVAEIIAINSDSKKDGHINKLREKSEYLASRGIIIQPWLLKTDLSKLQETLDLLVNESFEINNNTLLLNSDSLKAYKSDTLKLLSRKMNLLQMWGLEKEIDLLNIDLEEIEKTAEVAYRTGLEVNKQSISNSIEKNLEEALKQMVSYSEGTSYTREDLNKLADMLEIFGLSFNLSKEDLSLNQYQSEILLPDSIIPEISDEINLLSMVTKFRNMEVVDTAEVALLFEQLSDLLERMREGTEETLSGDLNFIIDRERVSANVSLYVDLIKHDISTLSKKIKNLKGNTKKKVVKKKLYKEKIKSLKQELKKVDSLNDEESVKNLLDEFIAISERLLSSDPVGAYVGEKVNNITEMIAEQKGKETASGTVETLIKQFSTNKIAADRVNKLVENQKEILGQNKAFEKEFLTLLGERNKQQIFDWAKAKAHEEFLFNEKNSFIKNPIGYIENQSKRIPSSGSLDNDLIYMESIVKKIFATRQGLSPVFKIKVMLNSLKRYIPFLNRDMTSTELDATKERGVSLFMPAVQTALILMIVPITLLLSFISPAVASTGLGGLDILSSAPHISSGSGDTTALSQDVEFTDFDDIYLMSFAVADNGTQPIILGDNVDVSNNDMARDINASKDLASLMKYVGEHSELRPLIADYRDLIDSVVLGNVIYGKKWNQTMEAENIQKALVYIDPVRYSVGLDQYGDPLIDKIIGGKTKAAIKAFQTDQGIKPDKKVGKITVEKLVKAILTKSFKSVDISGQPLRQPGEYIPSDSELEARAYALASQNDFTGAITDALKIVDSGSRQNVLSSLESQQNAYQESYQKRILMPAVNNATLMLNEGIVLMPEDGGMMAVPENWEITLLDNKGQVVSSDPVQEADYALVDGDLWQVSNKGFVLSREVRSWTRKVPILGWIRDGIAGDKEELLIRSFNDFPEGTRFMSGQKDLTDRIRGENDLNKCTDVILIDKKGKKQKYSLIVPYVSLYKIKGDKVTDFSYFDNDLGSVIEGQSWFDQDDNVTYFKGVPYAKDARTKKKTVNPDARKINSDRNATPLKAILPDGRIVNCKEASGVMISPENGEITEVYSDITRLPNDAAVNLTALVEASLDNIRKLELAKKVLARDQYKAEKSRYTGMEVKATAGYNWNSLMAEDPWGGTAGIILPIFNYDKRDSAEYAEYSRLNYYKQQLAEKEVYKQVVFSIIVAVSDYQNLIKQENVIREDINQAEIELANASAKFKAGNVSAKYVSKAKENLLTFKIRLTRVMEERQKVLNTLGSSIGAKTASNFWIIPEKTIDVKSINSLLERNNIDPIEFWSDYISLLENMDVAISDAAFLKQVQESKRRFKLNLLIGRSLDYGWDQMCIISPIFVYEKGPEAIKELNDIRREMEQADLANLDKKRDYSIQEMGILLKYAQRMIEKNMLPDVIQRLEAKIKVKKKEYYEGKISGVELNGLRHELVTYQLYYLDMKKVAEESALEIAKLEKEKKDSDILAKEGYLPYKKIDARGLNPKEAWDSANEAAFSRSGHLYDIDMQIKYLEEACIQVSEKADKDSGWEKYEKHLLTILRNMQVNLQYIKGVEQVNLQKKLVEVLSSYVLAKEKVERARGEFYDIQKTTIISKLTEADRKEAFARVQVRMLAAVKELDEASMALKGILGADPAKDIEAKISGIATLTQLKSFLNKYLQDPAFSGMDIGLSLNVLEKQYAVYLSLREAVKDMKWYDFKSNKSLGRRLASLGLTNGQDFYINQLALGQGMPIFSKYSKKDDLLKYIDSQLKIVGEEIKATKRDLLSKKAQIDEKISLVTSRVLILEKQLAAIQEDIVSAENDRTITSSELRRLLVRRTQIEAEFMSSKQNLAKAMVSAGMFDNVRGVEPEIVDLRVPRERSEIELQHRLNNMLLKAAYEKHDLVTLELGVNFVFKNMKGTGGDGVELVDVDGEQWYTKENKGQEDDKTVDWSISLLLKCNLYNNLRDVRLGGVQDRLQTQINELDSGKYLDTYKETTKALLAYNIVNKKLSFYEDMLAKLYEYKLMEEEKEQVLGVSARKQVQQDIRDMEAVVARVKVEKIQKARVLRRVFGDNWSIGLPSGESGTEQIFKMKDIIEGIEQVGASSSEVGLLIEELIYRDPLLNFFSNEVEKDLINLEMAENKVIPFIPDWTQGFLRGLTIDLNTGISYPNAPQTGKDEQATDAKDLSLIFGVGGSVTLFDRGKTDADKLVAEDTLKVSSEKFALEARKVQSELISLLNDIVEYKDALTQALSRLDEAAKIISSERANYLEKISEQNTYGLLSSSIWRWEKAQSEYLVALEHYNGQVATFRTYLEVLKAKGAKGVDGIIKKLEKADEQFEVSEIVPEGIVKLEEKSIKSSIVNTITETGMDFPDLFIPTSNKTQYDDPIEMEHHLNKLKKAISPKINGLLRALGIVDSRGEFIGGSNTLVYMNKDTWVDFWAENLRLYDINSAVSFLDGMISLLNRRDLKTQLKKLSGVNIPEWFQQFFPRMNISTAYRFGDEVNGQFPDIFSRQAYIAYLVQLEHLNKKRGVKGASFYVEGATEVDLQAKNNGSLNVSLKERMNADIAMMKQAYSKDAKELREEIIWREKVEKNMKASIMFMPGGKEALIGDRVEAASILNNEWFRGQSDIRVKAEAGDPTLSGKLISTINLFMWQENISTYKEMSQILNEAKPFQSVLEKMYGQITPAAIAADPDTFDKIRLIDLQLREAKKKGASAKNNIKFLTNLRADVIRSILVTRILEKSLFEYKKAVQEMAGKIYLEKEGASEKFKDSEFSEEMLLWTVKFRPRQVNKVLKTLTPLQRKLGG